MNVDNNRNYYMSIDNLKNITFLKELINNYAYHITLFLISALKGLFKIVSRNRYDSSYCLWCKFMLKALKNRHKESGAHIDTEK